MKKNFVLLICIAIGLFSFSQQKKTAQNQIKVLSWNIYMLPAITNLSKEIEKNQKKQRTEEIATLMNASDYDIIIFQEAFHIPSRKKLSKSLQDAFPYQYGPINKGFIKTSSGIFVVSKIPLTQLASIQYRQCNGSDCFARKGCVLLEGKIGNNAFQILGTHLNATSEQEIRESQYEQIYNELLKPYEKEHVAQFVCGDLNTNKSKQSAYQSMLKKLDAEDINTQGDQIYTTVTDKVEIDYILVRKNHAKLKQLDKRIVRFESKAEVVSILDGTLSDHLAVELIITF